jgi:hypothetical protein
MVPRCEVNFSDTALKMLVTLFGGKRTTCQSSNQYTYGESMNRTSAIAALRTFALCGLLLLGRVDGFSQV